MSLNKDKAILKILLGLYFLMLPLMNLPRNFPLGNKIQYADFIFIVLFILWLYRIARARGSFLLSKPIIISLAFLIITNLISCLNSVEFSKSLIDYLGLAYLITLFIVFSDFTKDKEIFNFAIWIIFLTSVATSIVGLAGFVFYRLGNNPWAEKLILLSPLKASLVPFARIKSTLFLPEMFIIFSQLGMVCGMVALELRNDARKKRLISLGVLIIVAAAVLAYSRSLTGFFLTLSAVVLFKKDIKFSKIIRLLSVGVLAVLLVAAIITSVWLIYPVTISHNSEAELMSISLHTSPDIRALLRRAALDMALEHPLFGIGQGMFTFQLKNYINLEAARHTVSINKFGSLEIDPHNTYFGAIAETGFVGLALLLTFIYVVTYPSLKSIRQSLASKSGAVELCLLAGIAGYLLTAWFADMFSLRQFWINLALLIAARNTAKLKNV